MCVGAQPAEDTPGPAGPTIFLFLSAMHSRSRDSGESWQQISGVPATSPINIIAQDATRASHIYVGTKQALFVSHDGGKSWKIRGGNLPYGDFTSILINPQNTDEIYISSSLMSDGGIFYSSDAGMKWKRVDSKDMALPSRRVWSMVLTVPATPAAPQVPGAIREEKP